MTIYAEMRGSDEIADVLLKHKDDTSPLTTADLTAHDLILSELRKLAPNVPVVSEEDQTSLMHRRPSGEFFLIDPLDGTKEFLAKNDEFTVNIALVRDGQTNLGVVVAPALGQSYWGGVGHGAFREHQGTTERIRVSQPATAGAHVQVVASKSHMNRETEAFIARIGPHKLVQAGSSLKFCRVAEGSAHVYPRMGPTCEWDTAAAQAIVEAAGGHVSTLRGTPLRYGKPDLVNPHFVASCIPFADLRGSG